MNTATLAPKNIWVRLMLDSPRRTQGAAITGCGMAPESSPRCTASWCTHHSQIFLNESGGSLRPHRMQFAMGSVKDYQQLDRLWEGHGFSRAVQTCEQAWALAPRNCAVRSMDGLGFPRHVIHQQILAQRVGRGEVGFAAAHFRDFLYELHQPIIGSEHERVDQHAGALAL